MITGSLLGEIQLHVDATNCNPNYDVMSNQGLRCTNEVW